MIYIVVDGTDGTGKTTFCKLLKERLGSERVKFPTSYPDEEDLRWPVKSALYYLNDFEETLAEYRSGDGILICDRSFLSTLAYQGFDDFFSPVPSQMYEAIFEFGTQSFFGFMTESDRAILVRLKCDGDEAYRRVTDRLDVEGGKDQIDALTDEDRKRAMKSLALRYDYMFRDLFGNFRDRFQKPLLDVVTYDTTDTRAEDLVDTFISEMFDD